MKILTVEDDNIIREGISEYLSEFGYTVIQAKDGREALSKFNSDINPVSYTHLDVYKRQTRYLENAETQKKAKRNGRKNVTVFSMAMANVTGNPKRTIGTILTMGFSCVLFVIISNYVGNIDTEHEARLFVNHGQFELQLDYSAEYDERYPENNLDTIPVSYTHLRNQLVDQHGCL